MLRLFSPKRLARFNSSHSYRTFRAVRVRTREDVVIGPRFTFVFQLTHWSWPLFNVIWGTIWWGIENSAKWTNWAFAIWMTWAILKQFWLIFVWPVIKGLAKVAWWLICRLSDFIRWAAIALKDASFWLYLRMGGVE